MKIYDITPHTHTHTPHTNEKHTYTGCLPPKAHAFPANNSVRARITAMVRAASGQDTHLAAAQQLLREAETMRLRLPHGGSIALVVPDRPLTAIASLSNAERLWCRTDEVRRRHIGEPPQPLSRPLTSESRRKPRTKHQAFLEKFKVGLIAADSQLGKLAWQRAVCPAPSPREWRVHVAESVQPSRKPIAPRLSPRLSYEEAGAGVLVPWSPGWQRDSDHRDSMLSGGDLAMSWGVSLPA